ncbi:hypothetical protein CGRA01v4_07397 [Colletotrichum graminicola]|nr:hypothetical protein CGRA01v4_07397 [Colletotrichum graminicola]
MIMSCHGLQLGESTMLRNCETEHSVATGNTPRVNLTVRQERSSSQSNEPACRSLLSCSSKGGHTPDSASHFGRDRLLCGQRPRHRHAKAVFFSKA